MSLDRETRSTDLFGLEGTFPRPGWVVLDAARDQRFTGEIIFDTVPEVRVYADRGHLYLAERVTDPSLGSRLVDAGALNAAQLEHGAIRLGDAEHLGRLFERVPSVDRHSVLVISEMMTEECVRWLAGQNVPDVDAVPYRHHPSGIQRWERAPGLADLVPGDPLPAPTVDEAPVALAAPEPLFFTSVERQAAPISDDMIQWDEVAWLQEQVPDDGGDTPVDGVETQPPADSDDLAGVGEPDDDWIDRLDTNGLPEAGRDLLTSSTSLPAVRVDRSDRFELIWPSGEVDEQFGSIDDVSGQGRDRELDRAGPTARVARDSQLPATQPLDRRQASHLDPPDPAESGEGTEGGDADDLTDEVVLAVRRAVASIETGSLAARRRLVDSSGDGDSSRGHEVVPPGRVAVRDEPSVWAPGGAEHEATSVFDDGPSDVPVVPQGETGDNTPAESPETGSRESALRRLIGSLRRR